MQFAQNLKKIMQEKNITNYRLAKILGVHPTTIKNWLESYTEPKFDMIDKIADVLDISIDELISENEGSKEDIDNNDKWNEFKKKLETLSDNDLIALESYLEYLIERESKDTPDEE